MKGQLWRVGEAGNRGVAQGLGGGLCTHRCLLFWGPLQSEAADGLKTPDQTGVLHLARCWMSSSSIHECRARSMAFQKGLLVRSAGGARWPRCVCRRKPTPWAQEARTSPARHAFGISKSYFPHLNRTAGFSFLTEG